MENVSLEHAEVMSWPDICMVVELHVGFELVPCCYKSAVISKLSELSIGLRYLDFESRNFGPDFFSLKLPLEDPGDAEFSIGR